MDYQGTTNRGRPTPPTREPHAGLGPALPRVAIHTPLKPRWSDWIIMARVVAATTVSVVSSRVLYDPFQINEVNWNDTQGTSGSVLYNLFARNMESAASANGNQIFRGAWSMYSDVTLDNAIWAGPSGNRILTPGVIIRDTPTRLVAVFQNTAASALPASLAVAITFLTPDPA
jgi:hypothetical protein